MKEQIAVTVGTKIVPAEAARLDPTKRGIMIAGPPPEEEVTGQHEADAYWDYLRCGWCGHVGRAKVHATHVVWYTCGWCGRDSTY